MPDENLPADEKECAGSQSLALVGPPAALSPGRTSVLAVELRAARVGEHVLRAHLVSSSPIVIVCSITS